MELLVLDGSEDYCDKCGQLVPEHNDIRALEAIRRSDEVFWFMKARHCLPVVREGVTLCPGSPSRAQYLEGQPRDRRSQYPYIPEDEQPYREAWAQMQKAVQ